MIATYPTFSRPKPDGETSQQTDSFKVDFQFTKLLVVAFDGVGDLLSCIFLPEHGHVLELVRSMVASPAVATASDSIGVALSVLRSTDILVRPIVSRINSWETVIPAEQEDVG